VAFIADGQAPVEQPGQGALHFPAMAAQPRRRLHTTAGDPRRDVPAAQHPPAARVVVAPLSPCSLAGRRRGRPGRPRGPMTAGTASTMGSSSCESWVLAADSPTASGIPPASISRWYLEPGLPRSTGFAPTSSPHAGPAHSRCRWRPWTSRPGHRHRASPAADGAGASQTPACCQSRSRRQQGLDGRPHLVRDELLGHRQGRRRGRHGAGSSRTTPAVVKPPPSEGPLGLAGRRVRPDVQMPPLRGHLGGPQHLLAMVGVLRSRLARQSQVPYPRAIPMAISDSGGG
jgi:hypothetical protein